MQQRSQYTISRPAEVSGVGFFTGSDVRIRFLPAPAHHGIRFLRADKPASLPIPARIECVVPRERRTALSFAGESVELVEHVLAALCGLGIDNCLVELDGPEPPGCDGSSRPFVEALLDADPLCLNALVPVLSIPVDEEIIDGNGAQSLRATARPHAGCEIVYHLDYGLNSPLAPQAARFELTRETFIRDIAPARTFLLEREAQALRAQGYGLRVSPRDLLVIRDDGSPLDNQFLWADECARHKVLDIVGDLALLGCDLQLNVTAHRSGHRQNAALAQRLQRHKTAITTPYADQPVRQRHAA